jgi:hypothetical protein
VSGERGIQGQGYPRSQQPNDEQWKNHARHAHTGGKHRNNLIRARHSTESKEQREEQGYRKKDDQDLGNLRPVKMEDESKRSALIKNRRAIVADVEDEPDREKADDAIDVRLQKIADNVAIEQPHGIFDFRFSIFDFDFDL